jgi:hypothetical protein
MNQSHLPGSPAPSDFPSNFFARPPSQTWEQIPLSGDNEGIVWVWFKPATAPQGLILRIPDETWGIPPQCQALSVRRLLSLAGVDPGCVVMWTLYGLAYQGMNGTNPLFDHVIPPPAPGMDPNIVVYLNASPFGIMPAASPVSGRHSARALELFERLDIEWNAAIEVEKNLERLRKMLVDGGSRLKALNRDLSSDERLYSSREDKADWQDARRFLRDGDNRLRACVKEFDIGDTSTAGYRKWIDQVYRQYVVPRVEFDGLEQALGQFEFYRKLIVNLQGKMNNAYLGAMNNGERRAQQVLNRIAGKVRDAQTKRNTLGVLLDG